MAVVAFVKQTYVGNGDVYKAEALATGDETAVLTLPGGQVDVSVHIYGTVGGSTVTVQGSLLNTQFNVIDDAYGSAMSYTAVGVLKPVGPAVSALKIAVASGSGVDIDVDVKILSKVRPG